MSKAISDEELTELDSQFASALLNGCVITRKTWASIYRRLSLADDVAAQLERFKDDWYVTPTPAMDALIAYRKEVPKP